MSDHDPHLDLRREVLVAHAHVDVFRAVYEHALQDYQHATLVYERLFDQLTKAELDTCRKLIRSGRHPVYCQRKVGHDGECWPGSM